MSGLAQRTGKLTGKQALAAAKDSVPLMALWHRDQELARLMQQHLKEPRAYEFFSAGVVKALGEPLVRMREFESNPGLWLFDDRESGITFVIWSDGWKKNPWKGTAYEAVVPSGAEDKLVDAYRRLFELVMSTLENAGKQ